MSASSRFAFVAVFASLLAVSAAQAAAADSGALSSAQAPRDAASGLASGKRMHKPMTIRKEMGRTAASGDTSDAAGSSSAPQAKTEGAPLKGVDVKLGR
jgi:hypothetical protein